METIKKYALLFDGVKEIGNNQGWEHVYFKELGMSFQELMETVGWKESHAWCAYFAELVWKLGYAEKDSTILPLLNNLFSASAVQTWRNFKRSDFHCSQYPSVGAVAIWRMYNQGNPTRAGHAGIVTFVQGKVFQTVEGNTNAKGSREGDQVAQKTRLVNYDKKDNGLNLLGFIHPTL